MNTLPRSIQFGRFAQGMGVFSFPVLLAAALFLARLGIGFGLAWGGGEELTDSDVWLMTLGLFVAAWPWVVALLLPSTYLFFYGRWLRHSEHESTFLSLALAFLAAVFLALVLLGIGGILFSLGYEFFLSYTDNGPLELMTVLGPGLLIGALLWLWWRHATRNDFEKFS